MSENLQIRNLEETIAKCNVVIRDVYDAVVGDIKGKQGLISLVNDMQARIKVIEEKMHRFEESENKIAVIDQDIKSLSQLKEELKDLKIKSAGIEKLINDKISPEIDDTKKKKWLAAGFVAAILAVWAIIQFVLPLILEGLKKVKVP